MVSCAECKVYACRIGKLDAAPENCPMRDGDITNTRDAFADPAIKKMARESALVEAEGYGRWSRLEEIIEFSHRMGFKKLGFAYCVGFREEAKVLHKVLTANGFEVASVCCKNGSIPKEELDITDAQKVRPGTYEAICNPIGQARVLNKEKTDFNIMLGLCVGHDSLFTKNVDAPTTTLVAKDRAMAHNPVGALYCHEGYFKKRLYELHQK